MMATVDNSPDGDAAKAAYRRLHNSIATCCRLSLVAAQAEDHRYAAELQAEIIDALTHLLVRSGVISADEISALIVAKLNARAETFERRAQAYLDGQKDMPR